MTLAFESLPSFSFLTQTDLSPAHHDRPPPPTCQSFGCEGSWPGQRTSTTFMITPHTPAAWQNQAGQTGSGGRLLQNSFQFQTGLFHTYNTFTFAQNHSLARWVLSTIEFYFCSFCVVIGPLLVLMYGQKPELQEAALQTVLSAQTNYSTDKKAGCFSCRFLPSPYRSCCFCIPPHAPDGPLFKSC